MGNPKSLQREGNNRETRHPQQTAPNPPNVEGNTKDRLGIVLVTMPFGVLTLTIKSKTQCVGVRSSTELIAIIPEQKT